MQHLDPLGQASIIDAERSLEVLLGYFSTGNALSQRRVPKMFCGPLSTFVSTYIEQGDAYIDRGAMHGE